MKDIKVVIGKNFGDEGKGQAVSNLCRGQAALVVRHNGGAQAGHTVEEKGFRFVFHQLGSGSLWGCPTYWSKTFLPDLLKLGEEIEGFQTAAKGRLHAENMTQICCEKDVAGREFSEIYQKNMEYDIYVIYAHPDCACTVIYDVLLNSLTEELRGEERHGSCGMGIFEAVKRSRNPEYRLTLRDFETVEYGTSDMKIERIAGKLEKIRTEYTLPGLQSLKEQYPDGWDKPEIKEWISLIEDDNLLWNVAEEMCGNFEKYIVLSDISALWDSFDRIVFENAQGLMLDEDNMEYYPHLTPSHTGLYNVVRLLEELYGDAKTCTCNGEENKKNLETPEMEIIYVTRTYVTRHGAGRLDNECAKESINPRITDATNLPNPWQHSLRFAKHPAGELFFQQMEQELNRFRESPISEKLNITVTIRLTHLDETDGKIVFADGDMEAERFEEICRNRGIKFFQYCQNKQYFV